MNQAQVCWYLVAIRPVLITITASIERGNPETTGCNNLPYVPFACSRARVRPWWWAPWRRESAFCDSPVSFASTHISEPVFLICPKVKPLPWLGLGCTSAFQLTAYPILLIFNFNIGRDVKAATSMGTIFPTSLSKVRGSRSVTVTHARTL